LPSDGKPAVGAEGRVVFRHNTSSGDDVMEHLRRCDAEFNQPLSSRVVLADYTERIMAQADRFEAWLEEGRVVTLVGLVAAYCNAADRSEAFITSVSVDVAQQRAGLGRKLVACAVQHAENAGFRRIGLRVHADALAARQVYHALGFVEQGRSGDEIALVRSLHAR
jgi:ribosomal protein S18 acetylase RimI-like enzyme